MEKPSKQHHYPMKNYPPSSHFLYCYINIHYNITTNMFAVETRLWSRNMLMKSFAETVPKCSTCITFIEYHDTPKVIEMAFGIGIPFERCEGRCREPPWWSCLLNFIGEWSQS
ncbi:unnamed protein product [Prunus brigantina]